MRLVPNERGPRVPPHPFCHVRTWSEVDNPQPGRGFSPELNHVVTRSWTSSLENCEKRFCYLQATQSMVFSYSDPSRLKHQVILIWLILIGEEYWMKWQLWPNCMLLSQNWCLLQIVQQVTAVECLVHLQTPARVERSLFFRVNCAFSIPPFSFHNVGKSKIQCWTLGVLIHLLTCLSWPVPWILSASELFLSIQ